MSALRDAFCQMLEAYPGPDAATCARWARAVTPEDTAKLMGYVRSTIAAIERVGSEDERAHLPMLRALLFEARS